MHAGGVLVDLELVVQVFEQGGREEQLLDRQDVRVVLGQVNQFLVGVAFHRVGDGHLRATQVGEDALLDFFVRLRDVLDFFLTLVLVAVHLEDAQDQILVRDVRSAHGLLEAFPVFTLGHRTNGRLFQFDFLATEFTGHRLVGAVGAVHGEVFVQGDFTFRRRVRLGCHTDDAHAVRRSGESDEILGGFPVFVTVLRALDVAALVSVVEGHVLDVGHHALEVVRGDDKLLVGLNQVLGGHDTRSELERGKFPGLVALGARHAQLEACVVLHGSLVRNGGRVAERLAVLPAHHGAVAGCVFALVVGCFKGGFTAVPHQNRGCRHSHLLGEVLGGELSCDVNGDVISLENDRRGGDFEVDLLNCLDHFGQAASREEDDSEHGRKYAHVCCEFRGKSNQLKDRCQPATTPMLENLRRRVLIRLSASCF